MKSPAKFPLLLALFACLPLLRANDEMFPPAPAAAEAIHFDGKGFLIHGRRTFIESGSIHYARVPSELWRDRLLKLKRGGFNTVQTYVFWNYHETRQGEYDFTTGSHDLGKFLQTAQEVGLYATVRVGPYDCAEWDSGGYPIWLRNIPGLRVRADDPAFIEPMDKFFDQLLPIVAAHQIHRGGNVILVQLENEDPEGTGTDMPNSYFTHLQKMALDHGIEVPYFFSGVHHGTNPGGSDPMDLLDRNSPWYSTETWIRWYNIYGNSPPEPLASYTRNIWNIIANGGAGFNLYMFHGGSNFDYWNDEKSASSYDYGTLVGEGGDLRNLYFSVRRGSVFATSFPDILANSVNASAPISVGRDVTADGSPASPSTITTCARTSPAGTIAFVRNMQATPQTAKLSGGQALHLDPLEIAPILVDTKLAAGIKVKLGGVRTFGLATHGDTTTWIVYGQPDEKGQVELDLDQDMAIAPGASKAAFQLQSGDARHPVIDFGFSEDAPEELLLTSGKRILRILAETPRWVDRTWIVGEPGSQSVVAGPDYVGDFSETGGKAQLTVARTFGNPPLKELLIYGEAARARRVAIVDPVPADDESAPALGVWQAAKADAPAAPDFSDANWLAGDPAPQLGADHDPTAYGWYRASFNAPISGRGTLDGSFANHAVVFLNGTPAGTAEGDADVGLDVKSGPNTVAIFLSHNGRHKAFGYVDQPLDTFDPKGISGPVSVTVGDKDIPVTGWKLHGGIPAPDAADLSWQALSAADLGVPAFFRTEFNAKGPHAIGPCPIWRLSTQGLSRGSVWLNGHNLGRYPEVLKIDGPYLPECWLKEGTNSLVIFDEEGKIPTAAVHLWCEKAASREVLQVHE